jgi:hypothetical protein
VIFLLFLLTSVMLAAGSIGVTVLAYGPSGWGPARVWYRYAIHAYAGSIVLGGLAVLAAVARDRSSRSPADGLHWAGLAAWMAIGAMQLIIYVMIMR